MFKAVLCISVLLIILVILGVGCDQPRVKFDQIKVGMACSEVIKLLGEPQQSETKTLGSWTGEVWRWRFGGQTIILQVNGDRVESKQLASGTMNLSGL